jgi:hypothetical protein
MRKLVTAIALMVAVPMTSGCGAVLPAVMGGLGSVSSGLSINLKQCMDIKVQKRLYLAESGFKGVSIGLDSAVNAGLKGEAAASALNAYNKLRGARSLAWTAYDTCNASSLATQVSLMEVFVADLSAFINPRPQ